LYAETEKGLEMVDKTLTADNKHLRAKMHLTEKENLDLKDKLKHIEESIKEKDKMVASLSIYRYNALHKKPENPPPCKACLEREKAKLEELRIAAIRGRICELN
jgi:predicted RNase H-like nuclease (RuvC/YqgF family)